MMIGMQRMALWKITTFVCVTAIIVFGALAIQCEMEGDYHGARSYAGGLGGVLVVYFVALYCASKCMSQVETEERRPFVISV